MRGVDWFAFSEQLHSQVVLIALLHVVQVALDVARNADLITGLDLASVLAKRDRRDQHVVACKVPISVSVPPALASLAKSVSLAYLATVRYHRCEHLGRHSFVRVRRRTADDS